MGIRRYNVSGEDLLPVRKLDHHGQLFQMREPSGVESQVLLLPYRAFAYPGAHGPGVFEEPARQKLVHHMFKARGSRACATRSLTSWGLQTARARKVTKYEHDRPCSITLRDPVLLFQGISTFVYLLRVCV